MGLYGLTGRKKGEGGGRVHAECWVLGTHVQVLGRHAGTHEGTHFAVFQRGV
jgi:hypothetical protein